MVYGKIKVSGSKCDDGNSKARLLPLHGAGFLDKILATFKATVSKCTIVRNRRRKVLDPKSKTEMRCNNYIDI